MKMNPEARAFVETANEAGIGTVYKSVSVSNYC